MAAPSRRLDEAVAERTGVTRSRARSLIIAGRVRVAGNPATKPGASIAAGAAIHVERARPFVSRGGEKLDGALADFGIDVAGARALDVGASTGGFTDCLLQRGAEHVTALDVGYGQIAVALRDDARVRVIERTNFRLVPDGALGAPFDLVTIDTSFISVVTMLDRARAFLDAAPHAAIVALVKPQFEAGRERLGGGGVVRDPAVHRAILGEMRAAALRLGLVPVALAASRLVGPAGNVEFFALVRRAGTPYDDLAIERALGHGTSGAVR
ncbi:MAG: TlyA family rRNA (cytidine-2'-O)-methyltransferase [Vulcanimicrobiaceae bacterium]